MGSTGYSLADWDVIASHSQYAGTDEGSIEVNRYTYWGEQKLSVPLRSDPFRSVPC